VLVHVLSGNVVDAGKVARGEFDLARLRQSLRPADEAAAQKSLWKSATDPKSGAVYWYSETTWQRQWTKPAKI